MFFPESVYACCFPSWKKIGCQCIGCVSPIVAALFLAGCGEEPSFPARPGQGPPDAAMPVGAMGPPDGLTPPIVVPKVTVENVGTGQDKVERTYIGRVEAVRKVDIQVRVSGVIEDVLFSEGGMVEKGQVLYKIESVRYEAAVKSAEARIRELEAEIVYASGTYSRQKGLYEKNAVSKDEMENALSNLEKFKAQKLSAEADLTTAREDLDYCTITAPFEGRMGRTVYPEGQYVTPSGRELVSITQVNPVYVRFPVSESDILGVFGSLEAMRSQARVVINIASGMRYSETGRIVIGDNEVESSTDSLNMWAVFDNADQVLQSGGVVVVTISRDENEVVPMVPITAVQHDSKSAFVYVLDGDNKAVRRDVIAGEVTGGRQAVYQGLEPGESVITDGFQKFREGDRVEPVVNVQGAL